jgi:hypothetical protein
VLFGLIKSSHLGKWTEQSKASRQFRATAHSITCFSLNDRSCAKNASDEKDLPANLFHPMREELQTCSLKHFKSMHLFSSDTSDLQTVVFKTVS